MKILQSFAALLFQKKVFVAKTIGLSYSVQNAQTIETARPLGRGQDADKTRNPIL